MGTRLVTVAHGTRNPDGARSVGSLVRSVARRLPDVAVVESYVELVEPTFASVMAKAQEPAVVVPLLLSTGHHVSHDLPEAARLSPFPVTIARTLGPDPLLAAALATRLRAAGAEPDDGVVLVVAGSRDPAAKADATVAGRLLQARWRAPVRVAYLSGEGPRVPDVMAGLREQGCGRIAVSPYLLAPGHFASTAAALATEHGASVVADALGDHPLLVELVARRYLHCLAVGQPRVRPGAFR